jgi:hypothetical protein
MKINEIEYSSGIQSLMKHLDPKKSKLIGHVDTHEVYEFDLGNGTCFFLYNQNNDTVLSYVAIDNEITNGHRHLRQLESAVSKKGYISTLLYFLTRKQNLKFIVSNNEPLTQKGLNWIISSILSNRKLFTMRDQHNNTIDVKRLYDEWENSRNSEAEGEISIFIESSDNKSYNKIFEESSGLLQNMYRIINDNEME